MDIKISIDVKGLKCPKPLVEARKKLNKMQKNEILEVIGDHDKSLKEIPMAMKESGDTILELHNDPSGVWRIIIQKTGE